MTDEEVYLFHQTPAQLAKDLIKHITIEQTDIVLEPFKGEGAFYDNLPQCQKEWCEIAQGRDWLSHTTMVDWVITNPPFRFETGAGNKRENAFYKVLLHFSTLVNKGVALLINDKCLAALTPNRIKDLESNGLYLHNMIVSSVKKWRGRYYFMIFKKEPSPVLKSLSGTY